MFYVTFGEGLYCGKLFHNKSEDIQIKSFLQLFHLGVDFIMDHSAHHFDVIEDFFDARECFQFPPLQSAISLNSNLSKTVVSQELASGLTSTRYHVAYHKALNQWCY